MRLAMIKPMVAAAIPASKALATPAFLYLRSPGNRSPVPPDERDGTRDHSHGRRRTHNHCSSEPDGIFNQNKSKSQNQENEQGASPFDEVCEPSIQPDTCEKIHEKTIRDPSAPLTYSIFIGITEKARLDMLQDFFKKLKVSSVDPLVSVIKDDLPQAGAQVADAQFPKRSRDEWIIIRLVTTQPR